MSKRTYVTLSQFQTNEHRTGEGQTGFKNRYMVIQTKNRLSPEVGTWLTEEAAFALTIEDTCDVTIVKD